MTDVNDDLFERLRAANPVPPRSVAGLRDAPEADALLERAMARRPRPSRAVLVLVAVTILLLVATLAAFLIVRHESPAAPTSAQCFRDTNLHGRSIGVPMNLEDPAASCDPYWDKGNFGSGPPPQFATCTETGRVLMLIPGTTPQTCIDLGLAVAEPPDQSLARFERETAQRTVDECLGEDAVRRLITDELAAHRLTGWTMSVITDNNGFDPVNRCASLAFDEPARHVNIIAIPPNRHNDGS